jgi:hypothetical protein
MDLVSRLTLQLRLHCEDAPVSILLTATRRLLRSSRVPFPQPQIDFARGERLSKCDANFTAVDKKASSTVRGLDSSH